MTQREGSLEAPTRHSLDWRSDEFYDDKALFDELERVFDICHGCRRCFNLCHSFPTLFDLVDESETMEVDGVARKDYWQVVDHCYLCDMCYMTKCPYVPPHEWNIDFPHLMLRAKAARFRKQGASMRDKVLAATDAVGKFAGIPVIAQVVNATNRSKFGRKMLEGALGVHHAAPVPDYHSKNARKRLKHLRGPSTVRGEPTESTRGKVVLYTTCYGNRNHPEIDEDLVAVFEHNGIPMALAETASIFCETLVVEAGLARLEGPERLAQLDVDLVGTNQVIVDIRSRFLFESELFRRRSRGTLSASELCEMMTAAQAEAYGDGLDQSTAHPYMWLLKPHYYGSHFYNWPYTYGLLFGLGLFARYQEDPEHFRAGYDDLLSRAGMDTAEELGAAFGLDVTDGAFWTASLDVVRSRIDDYAALAAEVGGLE